jgi:hypothetical protein
MKDITCKHCGQPIMWIEDGGRIGWIHCGEAYPKFSCEPTTYAEPSDPSEE